MEIVTGWWTHDRVTRTKLPNYQTYGLSVNTPPHEFAPSLKEWVSTHRVDKLLLVDPYGLHPEGSEVVTDPSGTKSVCVFPDNPLSDFVMSCRSLVKTLLVYIGPPPAFSSNRMKDLQHTINTIQTLIDNGVTPIIDSGGFIVSMQLDNPLTTLYNDNAMSGVEFEGWGNTPIRGEVWLGASEFKTGAKLWSQGSLSDQLNNIRLAMMTRPKGICLEPTVFKDMWDQIYSQL